MPTKSQPLDPSRPVLKWAGGKWRLAPQILAMLPERMDTYYEPFVGSAAIFFALANKRAFRRAVLSDNNQELIDVYRALKKDVEGVIRQLEQFSYDKETYYRVRALDPSTLELSERAARTIYLNRTGFNGLYRVNRSGSFNVPFGRYVDPKICDPTRLRAASAALARVKLEVADFEKVLDGATRSDAVYFDPPYVPLSKTSSFTAYSKHAFDQSSQERLAQLFEKLAARGISAVLSNSDTPLTRELYAQWHCEQIMVARSINSNTKKRGGVGELLVKNVKAPSSRPRPSR